MALPININELLTGQTVEWERMEFREGWYPQRVLRTICGFANDFNNWGGGYIILGIAESNGLPVLPPKGLEINSIEGIQRELNRLCRKILPNYFPPVEPVQYQGNWILVFWCPGGSNRPYKAPDSFNENPRYFYFIRKFSSTVRPTVEEERELLAMANQVPFDDQVNQRAQLADFDISSIRAYLNEIKSDLESDIPNLSTGDLAGRMNLAEGPDENLLPKNIGLLFFAKDVQNFSPQAKIEVVIFDDEFGTNYTEKIFSGQLHTQLRGALAYVKNRVLEEKVRKVSGRAEADRFFNYPYEAFEEALCNAVYHRGYDNDSTIEVRIYPSWIDIISFPGPLPPLDKEKLKNNQFDVRKYRNRRIGEFLKELHLTEGRSTGIPTILKAVKKNGSPAPIFETDDERTYFKTTFQIHSEFQSELYTIPEPHTDLALSWHQVGTKLALSQNEVKVILEKCRIPQPLSELIDQFKWKDRTKFKKKYLNPLIELYCIAMTIPDKPNSRNQRYITTGKGKELLATMKG